MIWALEGSRKLTALRRLWGQAWTGPSAVRDQSNARMRSPISPPPERKASGGTASTLRLPVAARPGGEDRADPGRPPVERPFLLGAHVRGHQQLDDLQAGAPVLGRLDAVEECPHEVPVLGLVAVLEHLAAQERHQALLGVLLLDQVLAGRARDAPAEEHARAAVQAVHRDGVLGAEQLHAEPEPGADEAPRRGGLG